MVIWIYHNFLPVSPYMDIWFFSLFWCLWIAKNISVFVFLSTNVRFSHEWIARGRIVGVDVVNFKRCGHNFLSVGKSIGVFLERIISTWFKYVNPVFRRVSPANLWKIVAVEMPMTEKTTQNSLKYCFSNFAVHIDYILPAKCKLHSECRWGVNSPFLTGFWVMLMLMVHQPHFQ